MSTTFPDVSEAELKRLNALVCPDCYGSLLKGPRGGNSRNVKCSKCGAEFNLCLGGSLVGLKPIWAAQRILRQ